VIFYPITDEADRLNCGAEAKHALLRRVSRKWLHHPFLEGSDHEGDRFLSGISRRIVLSTLAVLPALIGPPRLTSAPAQLQTDQLPSCNDGPVKTSISELVARITTEGGSDFVPVDQRIAVSDNEGALWCELPCISSLPSCSTVGFMHYDLGYFDLEQKTLQSLDNPFGTRLSPMS
jgi:hypothetical protein